MAEIEQKPKRECPVCKGEFISLGGHIATAHPDLINQLMKQREKEALSGEKPETFSEKPPARRTTREIINDYFEMMLQIQMMKQMSALNGMDMSDLKELANPTPKEVIDYDKIADIIDERMEELEGQQQEETGDPVANFLNGLVNAQKNKTQNGGQKNDGFQPSQPANTTGTAGLINP